ncbi:MAG: ribosomal RNA small subunit methyltransferase A [Cyanobacteria bacterium REEB65]|nr:ribosomal RNA small subunit methyltransferase A [Cyanobacteria bacterium REEB65]
MKAAKPVKPRFGVRARTRLGQHFLADTGILEEIAAAADLQAEDTVLEIGPGTGVLTELLAQRAGRVVAVELDDRMRPTLDDLCRKYPGLSIRWGDFLDLDWQDLGLDATWSQTKVVANIPYYVTTPILLKLLQADALERTPLEQVPPRAAAIVLMVQREVAERLRAAPGTPAYGSLSIVVQYAAEVEFCFGVPRSAFVPRPKVDSAVVRLLPRVKPLLPVANPRIFFRVVRSAFGQRRKILPNALLAAGFDRTALEGAFAATGIAPTRRGETLAMAEFANLAKQLEELSCGS